MRRNSPAKWVLPEAVDPPGVKCFVIQVPDDPQHIAAFRGALLNLASAYKWADDATHMAKDVALRWRQAIEEMSDCDMAIMLRTNPFDSCGAQVSYDGGVIWTEFFNARDCAVTTVRDALGNETPPGGSDPDPGQCFDLDMVINGNSMKVIPLAVASGWTLTITQLAGAWWDGNVSNYWQCPTGYQFALGTCTSNYIDGQSGDPIPSGAKHMQLIIRLADGTYDDIPLNESSYTVPAGQPSGNYFLLANDSSLGDNQGSVSLHLEACNYIPVINITYVLDTITPTGPASVNALDEFDVTWTKVGDPCPSGGVDFDQCVDIQLISVTGWTNCQSTSHNWQYCNGTNDFRSGAFTQPGHSTGFFGANGATTFTCRFKITHVY